MTRTVMCQKYNKELPALDAPPYPGAKGEALYTSISKQAWQDWMKHQTMLINEKHLSLMDPDARKYLAEQMDKFLSGDEYDQADGFVPPEK